MRPPNTTLFDTLGLAGAAVCAAHCLVGPLLLVAGPSVAAVVVPDEAFHRAMLWVVIPSAVLAFTIGCRRHRDVLTGVLGGVGLLAFVLAVTWLHDLIGEDGERLVTLASAGLLSLGHHRNFRLCRTAACAGACHQNRLTS